MGLLFPDDESENLFSMIGEIAQRVKNLSLRNVESFGNLEDRLRALMEHDNLAYGDTQAIDNGFAAADALLPDNVRMFGLHSIRHETAPAKLHCFLTTWIFTAYLPGNSLPACSGRIAMPKCNTPALSAVKE